jgi:hypothetical protein
MTVQLAIAAALAFWGGEWRDGVVILAAWADELEPLAFRGGIE